MGECKYFKSKGNLVSGIGTKINIQKTCYFQDNITFIYSCRSQVYYILFYDTGGVPSVLKGVYFYFQYPITVYMVCLGDIRFGTGKISSVKNL